MTTNRVVSIALQIPMMTKLAWVAFFALFAGFGFLVLTKQHHKLILNRRIRDVQALVSAGAYQGGESNNGRDGTTRVEDLGDLVRKLRERGIALQNPIAKDPSKPCYRLIEEVGHSAYGAMIEETDNVDDDRTRVVALVDGTVVLVNRK